MVVGETTLTFTRDRHSFVFKGLVVRDLDEEILAGIPFMKCNDVAIRPAKNQIILKDGTSITYGANKSPKSQHTVRRAHILRGPSQNTTVWPGSYVEVNLPEDIAESDATFAIEPRVPTAQTSLAQA